MKTNEFNLSEKIWNTGVYNQEVILAENIKEFIKKLKEEDDTFREKIASFVRENFCFCFKKGCVNCFLSKLLTEQEKMEERKDKLAGDKLI